jgi:hypothetical protein
MTRLLTAMTLATIFANVAMAAPADDIPADDDAPATCERADFRNHGQWVRCMTHDGVKGRDLAERIRGAKKSRKAKKDKPAKRKDKLARDGRTKDRRNFESGKPSAR